MPPQVFYIAEIEMNLKKMLEMHDLYMCNMYSNVEEAFGDKSKSEKVFKVTIEECQSPLPNPESAN